jgi:hypothetical protein
MTRTGPITGAKRMAAQDPLSHVASWLTPSAPETSVADDPIVALAAERDRLWDEADSVTPVDSHKASAAEAIPDRTEPAGPSRQCGNQPVEIAPVSARPAATQSAGDRPFTQAERRFGEFIASLSLVVMHEKPSKRAQCNDDPIQALFAERSRLQEICHASYHEVGEPAFDDVVDKADQLSEEIEREIIGSVATSAPGLIAQIRLLAEVMAESAGGDGREERLIETIITGINGLMPDDESTIHTERTPQTTTDRERRLVETIEMLKAEPRPSKPEPAPEPTLQDYLESLSPADRRLWEKAIEFGAHYLAIGAGIDAQPEVIGFGEPERP